MYKLYTRKELKCGFIILYPQHNIDLLKNTIRSIKSKYTAPYICVADDSIKKNQLKEIKALCPSYVGKKTFSSLINTGFKNATADWNIVVIAGTNVRPTLDQKFSLFVENDKDILFPVAGGKINFVEGTINGLFIHKRTFKEIGDMPDTESIELSKAIWGDRAVAKGCKFKAIVGSKIC